MIKHSDSIAKASKPVSILEPTIFRFARSQDPTAPILLHVKAAESDTAAKYRCWHRLWVSTAQPGVVEAVKYSIPGQGFGNEEVTKTETPFLMELGPCWGLPHVSIDLHLTNGQIMSDVFSDNLPSSDTQFALGTTHLTVAFPCRPPVPAFQLSLSTLRQGDAEAVGAAVHLLQTHGFAFLDMTTPAGSSDSLAAASQAMHAAQAFLAGPGRGNGSKSALVGHVSSRYKDSLRLLTGSLWEDNPKPLPSLGLYKLAMEMDQAQREVVEALATPLFGCTNSAAVGQAYDIPLLCSGNAATASKQKKTKPFALVDIVRYRDSMTGTAQPQMAVTDHVDPGLLILSLPEMGPGLELQDRDGEWRSPPVGLGVLWAGARAQAAPAPAPAPSGAQLKAVQPGRHRVNMATSTSPNATRTQSTQRTAAGHAARARVSCWHELCTSDQISPPMLRRIAAQGLELRLGGVHGTSKVLETLRRAEDHDLVTDVSGRNRNRNRKRNRNNSTKLISRVRGAPMSKSGKHDFVTDMSGDLADSSDSGSIDDNPNDGLISRVRGAPMSKSGNHNLVTDVSGRNRNKNKNRNKNRKRNRNSNNNNSTKLILRVRDAPMSMSGPDFMDVSGEDDSL